MKIELTEKNLMALQLIVDEEIKQNEKHLEKIKEDGYKRLFNMAEMLEQRNSMLKEIQEKLYNVVK